MARKRKIHVGLLNIVTHPHSPEDYLSLFEQAHKVDVPMGGDRRAMIGTISAIGEDPLDGIQGNIFRFTKLDMESPWLDTQTGKEIDPIDIHDLVDIPSHLRPNFSTIWYNFYPRTHRLVFEVQRRDPHSNKLISFSPSTAQLFFQKVFNTLKTKLSSIRVTIVQSQEGLDAIFSIAHLKSLNIVIARPNPNDGELEEMFTRQIEQQNVHEFEQTLKSKNPQGIIPSNETKILAQIATSNGYVLGEGTTESGEKVKLKTTLKPIELTSYFDAQEGFLAAFHKAVTKLLGRLRRES